MMNADVTRSGLVTVVTAVLAGTAAVSAQPDFRYAWIDLSPLFPEYQDAGPAHVNARGCLVGSSATSQSDSLAVTWDLSGNVMALKSLGGSRSSAGAITDDGTMVFGTSIYPNGSPLRPRAVVWRDGQIEDIGSLGGEITDATSPQDMNNIGQVVGASENGQGSGEPFVWDAGGMRALPNLGIRRGGAFAINDDSEIVGWLTDGQTDWPVLWRGESEITLLPVLNNSSPTPGFPSAINENGVIVGSAETQARDTHAAAWIDGRIYDIHTPGLGSSFSVAEDINNHDQIVGEVGLLNARGFIRNPGEQMVLLDDLVPPRLKLYRIVTGIGSINDSGQIAVAAQQPGNYRDFWAVLLTPVDPAMELAAPSPGSAGTSNTLSITGATPGARVYFCYSRHGGGTRIPGCDLQQNALQLDQPTIIGSAVADANGVATITRPVPLIARGQTILFQAVVQNECAISQLVVHEFQ